MEESTKENGRWVFYEPRDGITDVFHRWHPWRGRVRREAVEGTTRVEFTLKEAATHDEILLLL